MPRKNAKARYASSNVFANPTLAVQAKTQITFEKKAKEKRQRVEQAIRKEHNMTFSVADRIPADVVLRMLELYG